MPSLEQAVGGGEKRSIRSLVGVTLFVAGVAFVAVGLLSVVHSVVAARLAPAAAALWAATVAGLLLTAILGVLALRLNGWVFDRTIGLGSALAIGGLGLLWITAPSGWTGTPTLAVAPAAGTYAIGVLALVKAFVAAGLDSRTSGRESASRPTITVNRTNRPSTGGAALGDGGDDESDLRYLLDEDDENGDRR